jgi:type I restriction enzyme S subunit
MQRCAAFGGIETVISEGWEYKVLGEGIDLISGRHILANAYTDQPIGTPYLTGPADFPEGKINVTKYTQRPEVLCKPGDILLTVKGSGTGKLIRADQEYCISRQLMAIRSQKWNKDFVYYFLVHNNSRYEKAAAGLIPGISREDVLQTPILLPPLPEQRAIAAILGTWDHAIALTEQRLAVAEQRKKALMQKMLTGQVRFPEFAGEKWQEVRLGDALKERKERGYENLPLLSVTANQGIVYRDELDRRDSSSEDKSKYLRVCKGDIAYNTMRMWQGRSGVSELEGIVSPAYTVCTPKPTTDVHFMGHLFQLPSIIYLFYRYSQGLVSDTWNLKFDQFAKIRFKLPSLAEQKKIASVLDACDREIDLLRRKRDALQQQKKGLMQRLLTGRVRVKEAMQDLREAQG